MKDISIKDKCLIVITICVVVLTIGWWDIGRYELAKSESSTGVGSFVLFDTKNGKLYNTYWDNDEGLYIYKLNRKFKTQSND